MINDHRKRRRLKEKPHVLNIHFYLKKQQFKNSSNVLLFGILWIGWAQMGDFLLYMEYVA